MTTGSSMDSVHTLSGIHGLHSDIFFLIFEHNADPNNERPLETARYTSQVCRSWRNLMLTAPRIWGMILQLSELQVEKDSSPWRDLVMERTGRAPLFFMGIIPVPRLHWFLHFLLAHWGRTRKLDVDTLERLIIFNDKRPEFHGTMSRCIRTFHFPGLRFNLRAPWVANLLDIGLTLPFTTTEILSCLATIPRLHTARFYHWVASSLGEDFSENRLIPLPHLKYLHLSHYLNQVSSVLSHVVPNSQCEYTIRTFEYFHTSAAEWEVLLGCIQHRVDLRADTIPHIFLHDTSIDLNIAGDSTAPAFSYHHTFYGPTGDVSAYIERFRSREPSIFEKVTGLVFHVDNDCQSFSDALDASFRDFFYLFPSLTMLQLSKRSLRLVTDAMCDHTRFMFPSLKTLSLDLSNNKLDAGIEISLIHFLHQRRLCGRAITRLDIWLGSPSVSQTEWDFLEEFNLKVAFAFVTE